MKTCVFGLTFGSLFILNGIVAAQNEAQSIFPDKNLEAVVRKYVFEKRNNDEPLTEKDVEKISTIEGKGKGIKDLTGLDKCYSLALLDLEGNEVSDLGPIKELTNLQSVNLANNNAYDFGPGALQQTRAILREQEKPAVRAAAADEA